MTSDWKECKIKDLCSNVTSGGTPKSTNLEYYNGGSIPWLNTKEVRFNRIYNTEKHITEAGLKNSAAKWIKRNNVIVAMYGATAGNIAINKIPLTTNQACCNLEINEKIADYRFVYYNLLDKYTILSSMANGGAQQNLNSLQIKNFDIFLPPLETQKQIAAILSALDDKIELNNKINENLERQAQAIYQEYFSPKVTESEIVHTLDEFCNIFTGRKNSNASTVKENTNPDYIFALYWFIKLELSKKIMGGTRGSAIPYIVMNDLAKFEIRFSVDKLDEYIPIFKSIIEKIQLNQTENEILANVRDSLLPKLMNGEIDISAVKI